MFDFDRTEGELQRRFAKVSWRKKELVARMVCITMGDNRCRCDFLHPYLGVSVLICSSKCNYMCM